MREIQRARDSGIERYREGGREKETKLCEAALTSPLTQYFGDGLDLHPIIVLLALGFWSIVWLESISLRPCSLFSAPSLCFSFFLSICLRISLSHSLHISTVHPPFATLLALCH